MDRGASKSHDPADFITLPSGHRVLKRDFLSNGSARVPSDRVVIDKLPSMSGSIAGASSKFLQTVQKHKAIEEARLAKLDIAAQAERDNAEFEHQRLERKRQFDEEAAKKREKRQRRKLVKSKEGLDLPVEVVKQIKEQEQHDNAIVSSITKGMPAHPLSSTGIVVPPPPAKKISPPERPSTATIRIIDDDDGF